MRPFAPALALVLLALPAAAQQHIAPTPPRSPADERKTFKLPPGFDAQLVAAEPDIQKPIQIAFDAKGRLWVTTSHHYPFPAADNGKAADKLYVLSDFGPDGRAKTATVFADNLNIPIGILPLPDCKSCIVSSVGRILKLTDTDGDGKADKTEVLFTGFGTRDTHGMTNSFTLMPDGWVYACHGFANDSRVKGTDGHEVVMNSGHTFRFRPDGSRIEVYTHGQVNPFGIAVDPWFNLYTADCHTKPITQLIRGAYYDSFGKPHDGLGYAPHVTHHDHGSTALCGLAWYDADHFPAAYRGTMFLGNVVTNRINFDKISWKGSTPVAEEQPDFLVSGDPWFRPTDIKLGPDGALYVADFYNRIIGHYEVDLKHPGRDKDRGRVWRIVYTGNGSKPEMPFRDLTAESPGELIDLLQSPNITTRLLATQELIRRGKGVTEVITAAAKGSKSPAQIGHLCGVLAAFGERTRIFDVASSDLDRLKGEGGNFIAVHIARAMVAVLQPTGSPAGKVSAEPARDASLVAILTGFVGVQERDGGNADMTSLVTKRPRTFRAVVEGLDTDSWDPGDIEALDGLIYTTPPADTHLRYALRLRLRDLLVAPQFQNRLVWILKKAIMERSRGASVLDDVFLGVPTAYAGWWYAERFRVGTIDPAFAEAAAAHVGRYGCDVHRNATDAAIRQDREDPKVMLARLIALDRGVKAAGADFSVGPVSRSDVRDWLQSNDVELVRRSIEVADPSWPPTAAALSNLVTAAGRPEAVRAFALDKLIAAGREVSLPACGALVRDPVTPAALREKAFAVFATSPKLLDQITLKDMLKDVPYRHAVAIATGLATSKEGADLLFAAVKAGQASPRLLQEKAVLDRLRATRVRDLDRRVKELTAGLPSVEQRVNRLIGERAVGYRRAKPDVGAGKKVFAANCAACHQIGGQGGKVGPNLDGIGNRGPDRLLEDVLDPNRNVDAAFRATTLNLLDGRALTGLLVREEGAVLVLADAEGKEQRIPKADVERRATTAMSPMPANFGEKLKEDEFYQLLAYLLELRVKDVPPAK